ncbi:hypothetical protein [Streptomyces sp. NPDC006285]|uniref:hypothetical protein n=1 Tax=Streptomyces sp. NPDC006285 TaxID=3364742 RepID=UPI00367DE749
MSEVESAATKLKTQYAAQVAGDLERNTKEQERIGAEVAALEEQLRALRHDQTLLAELQRALGGDDSAQSGTADGAAPKPSVPRQASAATGTRRKKATTAKPATKSAAKPAATKPAAASGAPKPAGKSATKSAAVKPAGEQPAAGKPTLVELIRDHLGRQSEPRSSAEVATALAEAHPDRDIKPKVVRTTVEGLVARGQVQRTKQGSSVFYTTAKAAPAPAATADTGAAPTGTAEQSANTDTA